MHIDAQKRDLGRKVVLSDLDGITTIESSEGVGIRVRGGRCHREMATRDWAYWAWNERSPVQGAHEQVCVGRGHTDAHGD